MAKLIFNPQRCDLAAIPAGNFDFVPDCEVLPAPPPIFDCPELSIPIMLPAEVGAVGSPGLPGPDGCTPSFFIQPTGLIINRLPASASASATVELIPGSLPCNYEFQFSLGLPQATGEDICEPYIGLGEIGATEASSASLTANIHAVEGTTCGFEMDLHFYLPRGQDGCEPDITIPPGGVVAYTTPYGTPPTGYGYATKIGYCQYQLQFVFGIPKTCGTSGCRRFVWCDDAWKPMGGDLSISAPTVNGRFIGEMATVCKCAEDDDCAECENQPSAFALTPTGFANGTSCATCAELNAETQLPRITVGGTALYCNYESAELTCGFKWKLEISGAGDGHNDVLLSLMNGSEIIATYSVSGAAWTCNSALQLVRNGDAPASPLCSDYPTSVIIYPVH